MEQTHDITSKFKALLVDTTRELKSNVTLDRVKDTVRTLITPCSARVSQYSCMYNDGTKGRLRDVFTHVKLETYLEHNFCSWFNIGFIENLRKTLLFNETQDDRICEYKKHLFRYVKISCYCNTVCDSEKEEKHDEIVFQVSTDFTKLKKEQIDIFEHIVRQQVSIPECSRRVDGTGKLIFTVKQPTQVE